MDLRKIEEVAYIPSAFTGTVPRGKGLISRIQLLVRDSEQTPNNGFGAGISHAYNEVGVAKINQRLKAEMRQRSAS